MGPRNLSRLIGIALLTLCAAVASVCGGKSNPNNPSDQFTLSGIVFNGPAGQSSGIGSAVVAITAGTNSGRSTTADTSGRYTLDNLQGGQFTLRVSAPGFVAIDQTINLSANQVSNIGLAPAAGPKFTLTGLVFNGAAGQSSAIGAALIEITSGTNSGRSTTADSGGRYTLASLDPGQFVLRISASGYMARMENVDLTGDRVVDVGLNPAPTPPPGQHVTNGRVLDALTASGIGGIAINGDGLSGNASDISGSFSVSSATAETDPREISLSGAAAVERRTHLRVPGPDANITLIPSGFDLKAFDEMFRVTQLLRWTDAPPLTIQRRTLQFTNVNDAEFTATNEVMSDSETNGLETDLTWALPQLTGDRFQSFGSVTKETAAAAARVSVLTTGRITVARYAGLTTATGFKGYARWQYRSDGVVVGGTVMLDRDFDTNELELRRALRAHELGHALGYTHVTVRLSVMNANARFEPTDFDRDAARIAFQRPPGNKSPDIDPSAFSTNRFRLTTVWSRGDR